ncbi:sugar ABC transporter permease [Lachnoclostridium phytofermentans]|uniref:Binding-protein-dependent transport systems inner membrane component n=1 Tax=Lachnoclostridium phytofermentans (strain ATCC 700394 / DSM 18823 / ISDg) TaxID=357809 RepID=A9KKT5_LACP7|nr:sugar ABC transporter permease [Lachnoclostridium phytofermentans]ABX42667.1 binding-protein-dependent transport systems inner membrane component [Lachnoclostridium phytofermentans ISDg]
MNGQKVKKLIKSTLIHLELLIVAVIVLYPLIWVVGTSFSPVKGGISRGSMIPENATFNNYIRLFTETKYPIWFKNTLYVAVMTMIVSVLVHTLTAFVFARFPFKGRKIGLLVIMILQTFPSFLGLTALYMVALNFNMLNNLNMLVIVYSSTSIPGSIWLVRGYMLNIPKSLDEAAYIDGASKMQVFIRIILPLSAPIITFIAITSFMCPWMDYMLPRYLINKNEVRTMAIGLYDMITSNNADFTAFCAGSVIVAIPITILYMFFQKYIVNGLTAGANKGE